MTQELHWDLVEETLSKVFTQTTGLPARWLNHPNEYLGKAHGVLSMSSVSGIGADETLRRFDATAEPGEELETTLRGIRRFVWTARVNSLAHGSKVSGHPSGAYYLERLRTLLRAERIRGTLRGVGLSLVSTGPLVTLDFPSEGRMVSSAAMDVTFTAGVAIVDCPTTFVESVVLSSNLIGEDGNPLPADLQITEREIP